jgi:hypothetical protein
MPAIELVGSRKLASLRCATRIGGGDANYFASSCPPTSEAVASLNDAASAILASPGQPLSRSSNCSGARRLSSFLTSHKSILHWDRREPAPCFFLAMEVIVGRDGWPRPTDVLRLCATVPGIITDGTCTRAFTIAGHATHAPAWLVGAVNA